MTNPDGNLIPAVWSLHGSPSDPGIKHVELIHNFRRTIYTNDKTSNTEQRWKMESKLNRINKFTSFSFCLVHETNARVPKPRWRSRPGTLATVRPTAQAIKVLTRSESQMKPFPLIIPVYIHRIDCLLAAWTAVRPAIGSGHHLINTLSASSILSDCMAADGQMERWINNEEEGTEGQTAIDLLFLRGRLCRDFFFFFNLNIKCSHCHVFHNPRSHTGCNFWMTYQLFVNISSKAAKKTKKEY